MRLRLAAVLAASLLPLSAAAQYLDGLPHVGVPPAPALSGTDIVTVCQGGTAGVPGTCTPRQTTVAGFGLGAFSAPLTVATLPTCNAGAKYALRTVSDATAPTYNATLTGGGTVPALAFCDGTNWTAH